MNFDLQTALKYTTDTVQALLTELQKPDHNEHRWGTDQSKTLRGMLADALRDAAEGHTDATQIKDLHRQADLLQNPEQHIVVANGKVRAGRLGSGSLEPTLNHINQKATELGLPFGPVTLRRHEEPQGVIYSIADNLEDNPVVGTPAWNLHKSLSRHLGGLLENAVGYAPSEEIYKLQDMAFNLRHTHPEEVDADHPSERPQQ